MPTAFLDGNVGNNFIFIACFLFITERLPSWYPFGGGVLMNSCCFLTRTWRLALLPASRRLLFNQIHIFDKSRIEYDTLWTPVLLLYRRRRLLVYLYTSRILFHTFYACHTIHVCALCTLFLGLGGDLIVFVKLVIQQVAMKGVVSRTIFGLNFTCLREREVGGKWETAQPSTGFVCVCVCVCVFSSVCIFVICAHVGVVNVALSWVLAVKEWEVVKSGSSWWQWDMHTHTHTSHSQSWSWGIFGKLLAADRRTASHN